MRSVNKVILLGTVGVDPKVHYLDNGIVCAKFSLATNEEYKNKKDEKYTVTEWHNIILWRGMAETAEKYIKKGDRLYIEGKIQSRNWIDKMGEKRYITEIVGKNMVMLGRREKNTEENQKVDIKKIIDDVKEVDDIPF